MPDPHLITVVDRQFQLPQGCGGLIYLRAARDVSVVHRHARPVPVVGEVEQLIVAVFHGGLVNVPSLGAAKCPLPDGVTTAELWRDGKLYQSQYNLLETPF